MVSHFWAQLGALNYYSRVALAQYLSALHDGSLLFHRSEKCETKVWAEPVPFQEMREKSVLSLHRFW